MKIDLPYRSVHSITDDEFLAALTHDWQFQWDIFVALGGDPTDRNYAYLSHKTTRLRAAGHKIETSRAKGIRLV